MCISQRYLKKVQIHKLNIIQDTIGKYNNKNLLSYKRSTSGHHIHTRTVTQRSHQTQNNPITIKLYPLKLFQRNNYYYYYYLYHL